MNIIPTGLTRTIARQILTIRKNSPRTMFVGGILGIGASTVLACRATLKLEDKLDDFKKDVETVKNPDDSVLSVTDRRKDLAYVYVKDTYSLVRLYTPAILVGGVSIGLLTVSHVTLSRRNASLTAAYSALQYSFDQYMMRVKDELGVERERDIHHGVHNEEVTIDGKKVVVPISNPNERSVYSRLFDEYNPNWVKNAELNKMFILCQQNYLNHRLHSYGHVFLNEAYDALGIERSSAGAVVGWVLNKGQSTGGDNYIDFGTFDVANAAFINGYERSILLDFNVDGVIYDKI